MENLEFIEHSKSGLRNLNGRYRFMMATMLVALLASIFQFYKLMEVSDIINNAAEGDEAAASEYARINKPSPLSILFGMGAIANVVAVCMFIYMAGKNVYSYYGGALKYSPGWMVGWFFIPVAQIFMPFLSIRELSKASNAMINGREASSIETEKAHGSMLAWGTFWILQWSAAYLSMFLVFAHFGEIQGMDPEEIEIYTFSKTYYIQLASNAFSLISGIALLVFGARITREHYAYANS